MAVAGAPGRASRHRRWSSHRARSLAGISCVVGAVLLRCVGLGDAPLRRARLAGTAFAQQPASLGASRLAWPGAAANRQASFDSDRRSAVRVTASSKGKGFGSPAATVDVAEPQGGWPTVSIIVLNSESKASNQLAALKQLAAQDYPKDLIREIVVSDAEKLTADAPAVLRPLLKDFAQLKDKSANLGEELAGCSGDFIAMWGDDHVSPTHRLKSQVARAIDSQAATLLQPTWFFDPVGQDFMRVRSWPVTEFQDFMQSSENETVPEGFAQLMVCADALTLCGSRSVIMDAAKTVRPSPSPSDELKELLLKLLKGKRPQVIEDLSWAAVRAPPSATRYEAAVPPGALASLAQEAWPKGKAITTRMALDEAIKEANKLELGSGDTIMRLLAENVLKPLSEFDLKRVREGVGKALARKPAADVAGAVVELLAWRGLEPDQGDSQAVRNFPIFFAAFSVVREFIVDNADLFPMSAHGQIAEGLVRLGLKMWATDARVNEAMVKILARETYAKEAGDRPPDRGTKTADFVGTLGLREPLQAITFAARDLPDIELPASALASLAWALAEAGISNSALQIKVAKGVINDIDKVEPPDVGKLFVAMHDKEWFKDEESIAYLTQALVARVRELKNNDAGLAKMIQDAQTQAAQAA